MHLDEIITGIVVGFFIGMFFAAWLFLDDAKLAREVREERRKQQQDFRDRCESEAYNMSQGLDQ